MNVDEDVMSILRTEIMGLNAKISVLKDIVIMKQAYIIELERCMISFMENNGPGISKFEAYKELKSMESERTRDSKALRQLKRQYPEVFNNV